MQKAEAQQANVQSQPAAKKSGVDVILIQYNNTIIK